MLQTGTYPAQAALGIGSRSKARNLHAEAGHRHIHHEDTHRSMMQTRTSWRYTQKHDADTYPPIIKIHTEAQCRHIHAHHKGTQLTCKSTTQTHTHPSWRHATYMQKYAANTYTPIIKDTHLTRRSTMQTHAHPSWKTRILHTEAQCRHMCLGCDRYWPYTWLSIPISVSVDIVRYTGTTQDCQHRFLSLRILWETLALHMTVNTDFCLWGYCERHWPYTWLSTLLSLIHISEPTRRA